MLKTHQNRPVSKTQHFCCVLQQKSIRNLAFQYSNLIRRYIFSKNTYLGGRAGDKVWGCCCRWELRFLVWLDFWEGSLPLFPFPPPHRAEKNTHAYLSKSRLKQFMKINPLIFKIYIFQKTLKRHQKLMSFRCLSRLNFEEEGAKRSLLCKNIIFQMVLFLCKKIIDMRMTKDEKNLI